MPKGQKAEAPLRERLEWMKEHMHLVPREALKLAQQRWPTTTLASIYVLRSELRKAGLKVPSFTNKGAPMEVPEARARSGRRPMSPATIFILNQPPDMPPAEVVKAAHEAGVRVTRSMVFAVRKRHGTTPRPDAKPRAKAPLAKPTKKRRAGGWSALTKFILSVPAGVPTREVVERARKAGFKTDSKQISSARARYKDLLTAAPEEATQLALPDANTPEAEVKVTRKYTRKERSEQIVLPLGSLSTDEADFMGIVLGIGYNRAARLLAQFRTQFFDTIKQHTTNEP